jgi:diguanylate cyclase (GGDEF)-like protein
MSITKKTLLVIIAMFAMIIVLIFFYFRVFVLKDYVKLEKQFLTKNIEQSKKALEDKINSIFTTARDWSAWDDTYSFISDGNREYADSNLVEENFSNFRINLFALIDNDKNIKYFGLFDLNNNTPVEAADDFKSAFLSQEKLVHHDNELSKTLGIAMLNGTPTLIVSLPILKSDDSGPVKGTLVMGEYLSEEVSGLIGSTLGYPVDLYNIYSNGSQKYEKIVGSLTSGKGSEGNIEILYPGGNNITGYTIINDIYDKPILLLHVSFPRDIYQEGEKHINEFLIFTIATAVICCLMIFFILKKTVLSRITNLNTQTISVGQSRDFSKNILVSGNDEISKLARGINSMIVEIKKYENEINHLSFHDYLTGIYNRAFFEEALHRLDTERQLPLTIVIGDVNGLKTINDTFGHEKGDALLIKIANILKESFRMEDIVARWGGDEFTIILPRIDMKNTLEIITRVNNRFIKESTEQLPLGVSFGTSTKTDISQNIDKLIKIAEDRMYKCKIIEQKNTRNSMISYLGKALEEREYETEKHVKRMEKLASSLCKELDLPAETLNEICLLAALHDIGKISISESIILKLSSLTPEEWKIMKTHPEIGYRIAKSSMELACVADGILYHHERWDGKGYPKGISHEDIPLISRVISIVDAFDSMTNYRPYRRKALSIEKAIEELKKGAGSQFDPNLTEKFIGIIESNQKA